MGKSKNTEQEDEFRQITFSQKDLQKGLRDIPDLINIKKQNQQQPGTFKGQFSTFRDSKKRIVLEKDQVSNEREQSGHESNERYSPSEKSPSNFEESGQYDNDDDRSPEQYRQE